MSSALRASRSATSCGVETRIGAGDWSFCDSVSCTSPVPAAVRRRTRRARPTRPDHDLLERADQHRPARDDGSPGEHQPSTSSSHRGRGAAGSSCVRRARPLADAHHPRLRRSVDVGVEQPAACPRGRRRRRGWRDRRLADAALARPATTMRLMPGTAPARLRASGGRPIFRSAAPQSVRAVRPSAASSTTATPGERADGACTAACTAPPASRRAARLRARSAHGPPRPPAPAPRPPRRCSRRSRHRHGVERRQHRLASDAHRSSCRLYPRSPATPREARAARKRPFPVGKRKRPALQISKSAGLAPTGRREVPAAAGASGSSNRLLRSSGNTPVTSALQHG